MLLARCVSSFGLDQPIYMQYLGWIGNVLQGNLGNSWTRGLPVTDMIGPAFMVTLEIAILTLAVATLVGVPLGIIAGIYENRPLDTAIQTFNILGLSAPVFLGWPHAAGGCLHNLWLVASAAFCADHPLGQR